MSNLHFTVVVYGAGPESPSDTDATIRSLLGQTYANWTLVESQASDDVGNATLPDLPPVPAGAAATYVVVLPRGARLQRTALELISEIASIEGARLVTWDGLVRDGDEDREVLVFGWSPETLFCFEYTRVCLALFLFDYLAAVAALG